MELQHCLEADVGGDCSPSTDPAPPCSLGQEEGSQGPLDRESSVHSISLLLLLAPHRELSSTGNNFVPADPRIWPGTPRPDVQFNFGHEVVG